jgi:DNA-binding transcriptional MerR regulator
MIRVGDFARIAKVSIRLLHYYDQIGLLHPIHVDDVTGYRSYSTEQLPRLHRILALKDLGLSLDQITYLLNEAVTPEAIRGILQLKQAELRQRVDEEQARLARVEARVQYLECSAAPPDIEIVMKRTEPMSVLSVRRALKRGENPVELIRDGIAVLRECNLWQYVESLMCIYHTRYIVHCRPGIQPRRGLAEAAYAIDLTKVHDVPRVRNQRMRAYTVPNYDLVASVIHVGADNIRHLTAQEIWNWIERNHFRLAAPPREIYLRRGKPERPQDNITEMQYPLEKIGK